MSKYDFNIDRLDPNTAHGKVLGRVKPGSTVLECGCATGYMTRYMKEKLGCEVDIIEKDYDAYNKARQYSRDGAHGDLLNSDVWAWFEYNRYDYILFTDVLEHMTDPIYPLEWAMGLLNPDGRIIVSIPNICHNDIILNMFDDRFTYTQYGILDNTHVHFWGLQDFELFCSDIGLQIAGKDTVIIPTGRTEQAPNLCRLSGLVQILKQRPNGEVFQWIFELSKPTLYDQEVSNGVP